MATLDQLPEALRPAEPVATTAPSDSAQPEEAAGYTLRPSRRATLKGFMVLAGGAALGVLGQLPTARLANAYNTCTPNTSIRPIDWGCGYVYTVDNDPDFSFSPRCVRCSPSTVDDDFCSNYDDYHIITLNCNTATYPSGSMGHRANECPTGYDGWFWSNASCCLDGSALYTRCHDGFFVLDLGAGKTVVPTICPKWWCA